MCLQIYVELHRLHYCKYHVRCVTFSVYMVWEGQSTTHKFQHFIMIVNLQAGTNVLE